MISEKKNAEKLEFEQKLEFENFNCFFVDFLRSNFGGIKVKPTVVEREYTPGIN